MSRLRLRIVLAIAACTALAVPAFSAPAAQAAAPSAEPALSAAAAQGAAPGPGDVVAYDGINTFQNLQTRLCMWSNWGGSVYTTGCDALSDYQKWWIRVNPDSTRTLSDWATGLCLDDSFDYGLRTFTCNNLNYQNWAIHRSAGNVSFQNINTGRCVYDGGGWVSTTSCNIWNDNQWWY